MSGRSPRCRPRAWFTLAPVRAKRSHRLPARPTGMKGLRYPGTCRNGVTNRGRAPALRFRFDDPSPGFEDALCGSFPEGRSGGDFVLRRADGIWAYQLAVVVDDAEAGISEVIRGEDLLSSTPRQIALYRALGHPVPRFAHVGLVLGAEGNRLASRHGAVSISSLRNAGRAAEQVIGQLACSIGLRETTAPISAEELISSFALERSPVPRSPGMPRVDNNGIFDPDL